MALQDKSNFELSTQIKKEKSKILKIEEEIKNKMIIKKKLNSSVHKCVDELTTRILSKKKLNLKNKNKNKNKKGIKTNAKNTPKYIA